MINRDTIRNIIMVGVLMLCVYTMLVLFAVVPNPLSPESSVVPMTKKEFLEQIKTTPIPDSTIVKQQFSVEISTTTQHTLEEQREREQQKREFIESFQHTP